MMKKNFFKILTTISVVFLGLTTTSRAEDTKIKNLDLKQQEIIKISALTANGNLEELKIALDEGLNKGLTINEIKEILTQLYAYCGFPRSLNAITVFMNVVENRKSNGIKDEPGKEPTPIDSNKNIIELGTDVQTKLVGNPVNGPLYDFVPAMDQYLKGHLFGDIFGRDNLDYQTRELATIGALAGMEGVGPQLQAHFLMGTNTGLASAQLKDIIIVLRNNIGNKEAENAEEILNKFLSN